jgi:hypothetical protein
MKCLTECQSILYEGNSQGNLKFSLPLMQNQGGSPEFFGNKLVSRRFDTMCDVILDSSLQSHSNCEHG